MDVAVQSAVNTISSALLGTASRVTDKVLHEGYLYKQGIFKDWNKRYVELTEEALHCYTGQGGLKLGVVNLTNTTQFADSNLRHFCFSITDHSSGEVVYFASLNSLSKETWKEHIITQLTLIQQAQRKGKDGRHTTIAGGASLVGGSADSASIRNNFHARPILYIKIIQARNLLDKDIGGTSDPFVEVTVGASKEKTSTRKKTLDPVWGMVFKFDWESSNRFAKIEVWDEDLVGGADFLGCVLIPLFSLRDGDTSLQWYPLCKRSSKSHIRGEIEVELSCEGLPGLNPHVDRLFREIQCMPEYQTSMLSIPTEGLTAGNAEHKGWQRLQESRGFPFYFPPCETELLEDLSVRVTLVVPSYVGKVFSSGVLLLTNYRLIFVSRMRLVDENTLLRNVMVAESDLSTEIAISSVFEVLLSSESDPQSSSGSQIESLSVKCSDGRSFTFLFRSGNGDDSEQGGGSGGGLGSGGGSTPTAAAATVAGKTASVNSSTAGTSALSSLASTVSSKDLTAALQSGTESHIKLNGKRTAAIVSVRIFSATTAFDEPTGAGIAEDPGLPFTTASSSKDLKRMSMKRQSGRFLGVPNSSSPTPAVLPLSSPSPERPVSSPGYQPLPTFDFIGVGQAWDDLCRNMSVFAVDSLDSEEGGPACRMYNRLFIRRVSRHCERLNNLSVHKQLLETLRGSLIVQQEASEADVDMDSKRLPMGWSSERDENLQDLSSSGNSDALISQDDLLRINFSGEALLRRLVRCVDMSTRGLLFTGLESGWYLYDPVAEYARFRVPDHHWRLTEANNRYELCPTYPAITAVPQSVDDVTLTAAASFRSKNRYPVLCWRNPVNFCSISRCSQPLVGISYQRNVQDEYILQEISKCSGGLIRTSQKTVDGMHTFGQKRPYVIADARPLLNAKANQAAGKGVENEKFYENAIILFLGIPNIHAIRKSLEMLDEACADESSFAVKLEASGWLNHINKILKGVLRIVHCVGFEDLSVVVHCSDGWDRTSQLTSLSMLLLDAYYRTLPGFIVLIEKEWLSFGHKFADRMGWSYEGWKDEERSPIFQQFLDCVFQYLSQIPNVFQFNEELLLFILTHVHSGWFGDFMFNCEQEKRLYRSQNGALSMWAIVLNNQARFTNPNYSPQQGVVLPVARSCRTILWTSWFHRWNDRVWKAAWLQECAIEEAEEPTSTKLWVDDKSVSGCRRCQKFFTLTRRRHHCRRCGHIFCERCAGDTRIVSTVSTWRPSRVCVECAIVIDQDLEAEQLENESAIQRVVLQNALKDQFLNDSLKATEANRPSSTPKESAHYLPVPPPPSHSAHHRSTSDSFLAERHTPLKSNIHVPSAAAKSARSPANRSATSSPETVSDKGSVAAGAMSSNAAVAALSSDRGSDNDEALKQWDMAWNGAF